MMRGLKIAIFGILYAGVAFATPARVTRVIDGDTFDAVVMLDDDIRVSVRVRMRDLDTPEIHGKCDYERNRAAVAREKLAEMIPAGSIVELSNVKDDKYLGRIDANVAIAGGADVSARMVRAGLGRRYNGGKRAGWCR